MVSDSKFFNSICNRTIQQILLSFNSHSTSGLPWKDSLPMEMVFRFFKSIHYDENAELPSKTVFLQDRKQPSPITTSSSDVSPFSTNVFTFCKDPLPTFSFFRFGNRVNTRVSATSLQVLSWMRITCTFPPLTMASTLSATN